jgi:outer membrane protein TolC
MKKLFAALIFISFQISQAAPVLDFSTALERAMQKSETVKEQEAQNRVAEWQKTATVYNVLPKFSASVGRAITNTPSFMTDDQYGLTTTLNLYRGGADLHSIKAATEQVRSTMSNTDNTILQTEESAATDLLNTVYQRQLLELLQTSLEYDNRYFEIAEKKYQNGAEALEQLDKVRIDRSNTEAEVRDAELNLATALAKQYVWIENFEVANEWPWLKTLRAEKTSGVYRKRIAKDESATALEKRPDVKSSEYNTRAQNELLYAAKSALLPSIDLAFTVGQQNLGPGWEAEVSSSVMLTWPIFNGLKDYSNYRIANENFTISQYAFELLKRQADADLSLSETNFIKSVQTAVDRENVVESSLRLLRTTEKRFQTGHATPDELSLDQHRVIQARVLVAKGWLDAHMALVHFAHSRGMRVHDLL